MHQNVAVTGPRFIKKNLSTQAQREEQETKTQKEELEIQQNTEQQTHGSISVQFPHFDITRSTENKRSLRITPRDKGRKSANQKEKEHVQRFMQVKQDILSIPGKKNKQVKVSFGLCDTQKWEICPQM